MESSLSAPGHSIRIPRVTPFALILALAALIFIFNFINCFRGLILHSLALDTLEQVLKTSSTESVEHTLDYLDHTRSEKEFFGIFTERNATAEQRESLLRVALALRSALIAENRAGIRIAISEITRAFLTKHSFTGALAGELVNIQRLLNDHLREHQRIIGDIAKTSAAQKELNDERALLHTRYELIEGDLTEFFSLNLKASRHRGEIIFYSSGVLIGLPMISDIHDGLSSLVDLRNELERVGGKVRVDGEDAHEKFIEQLGRIQEQSREIYQRYREIETARESLTTDLLRLKNKRRDKREHLISTINHLIIALAAH